MHTRWNGALVYSVMLGCSSASWTDTFRGQDTRSALDDGGTLDPEATNGDDPGTPAQCDNIGALKAPVSPIVVTFPGHGTPAETIHIVFGTLTCDLSVDTDTDGVVYVSDATTCASLLAPEAPSAASATASGPDDLLFQWTYGTVCTINDDYALSPQ